MTNLNIAKLYLAANAGTTATALDAAIADTSANTAVQALTTAAFVEAAYQAAFGRSADAEGLAYWSDRIDNGGMAKDDAFMTALNYGATVYVAPTVDAPLVIGTETFTAATAEGVNDVAVAANKATAEAAASSASVGSVAAAVVTVTEVASTVTAAIVVIDAADAAIDSPANVIANADITLTTSADIVPSAGQDMSADNIINAFVGTNTVNGNNQDTISSIDVIDGGAGEDTINIQQSSTANVNGATIANVENIVFTQFGNQAFNMSNVTNLETFTNKGSIGNTTLTAVDSILDLTVQNVNANNTVVAYNASAVSGVADVQKVTLSNASNNASLDFSDAAIETLELTSTGSANKITVDDIGTTITKVTVDGDKDLTLSFLDATATTENITSFDASAATGNVTADLVTNLTASKMAVKTGTGDDKVTFAGLTKDDSFDMGAGSDTLVVGTLTTQTTATTMTGVENLVLSTGAGVAASLNASLATELETITILERTDNDADATTANAGAADLITITKAAATAKTINFDTMDGTTDAAVYDNVSFALATATGTTDELTLNFQNTNALGVHIGILDEVLVRVAAVTANKIETINIVTADLGKDDATVSAVVQDGLAITALNTDSMTTLNITSDSLVTIGNTIDAKLNTINATDATAGVSLDLSLVADTTHTTFDETTLTVNTGAGNDTLNNVFAAAAGVHIAVINTGDGKDTINITGDTGNGASTVDTTTINAGAGNDTVDLTGSTTLAAAATINVTLGDGVDTITLEAGATAAATISGVTIADFLVGSGGDKIDLVNNAIVVGGTGSITDYAEVDNGTDYTANTMGGLTVYTANDLATLDGNGLETAAAAAAVLGTGQALAHTAGDVYFVIAGDGTDAGLFLVADAVTLDATQTTAANADTVLDGDEILLLATLTGVSDTAGLTVDNFTDFLA